MLTDTRNPTVTTPLFSPEAMRDAKLLVEEIRQLVPTENSTVKAVLQIRQARTKREVPLRVIVERGADTNTWTTTYEVSAVADSPAERLVVMRSPGGRSEYRFALADADGKFPALKPILADPMTMTLGGSDFALGELGLDFINWPTQNLLAPEMRLGRPCVVLESRRPGNDGTVMIRAWIDNQTGGILVAEAYDAKGSLLKEFNLSGSSFKMVNGRYELEEMTMSSLKKRSETKLRFDLAPAKP
jgi:hypothetical protein